MLKASLQPWRIKRKIDSPFTENSHSQDTMWETRVSRNEKPYFNKHTHPQDAMTTEMFSLEQK